MPVFPQCQTVHREPNIRQSTVTVYLIRLHTTAYTEGSILSPLRGRTHGEIIMAFGRQRARQTTGRTRQFFHSRWIVRRKRSALFNGRSSRILRVLLGSHEGHKKKLSQGRLRRFDIDASKRTIGSSGMNIDLHGGLIPAWSNSSTVTVAGLWFGPLPFSLGG